MLSKLVSFIAECRTCGYFAKIDCKKETNLANYNDKCAGLNGCKGRLVPKVASYEYVDYQVAVLTEKGLSNLNENTSVTGSMKCEIFAPWIGVLKPGLPATISGILALDTSASKSATFNLSLEVAGVSGTESLEEELILIHLGSEENMCCKNETPGLPFLVYSFCPRIKGTFLAKVAMLLAAASSGSREDEGSSRKNINVLFVGDPGVGKSQLMRALLEMCDIGKMVSGGSTSSTGLTASIVPGPQGNPVLRAGALAVANNGICCIDELDKLVFDSDTLLEAMEQRRISIAKGGFVCSLPTNTTLVAACNPNSGFYRFERPLTDNINLSGALQSRFDIKLVMTEPSRRPTIPVSLFELSIAEQINHLGKAQRQPMSNEGLAIFLKSLPTKDPVMQTDVKQTLVHFFISEREKSLGRITIRFLESAIRVSTAFARLDQSAEITQEHAKSAIEFLTAVIESSSGMQANATQYTLAKKSKPNPKPSKIKLIKLYIERLKILKHEHPNAYISFKQLEEEARKTGLLDIFPNFDEVLENLNQACWIIRKANNLFEIVT